MLEPFKTEEAANLCRNCLMLIREEGKGCAWRSLGNEYCSGVELYDDIVFRLKEKIKKVRGA